MKQSQPKKLDLSVPMAADDVFQTTLLTLAEVAYKLLKDRNPNNAKRLYWLEKMRDSIDAIANSYIGYLPNDFVDSGEVFHTDIEKSVVKLLKTYNKKPPVKRKAKICS